MSGAARVWARYAAAYSLALGLILIALIVIGARRILAGVLVQAALAEVLLGAVGIVDRRRAQVVAAAASQPAAALAAWRPCEAGNCSLHAASLVSGPAGRRFRTARSTRRRSRRCRRRCTGSESSRR
jgi:hypothetical protein